MRRSRLGQGSWQVAHERYSPSVSDRWGLEPGHRLGRYEIVQGLARGGMGEVYLARMRAGAGAHKVVAIKRILPHHLDDDEVRRMFFREGRVALLLDHPNVVQIFDLAEVDGEHFISMEYIRGASLRAITKRPQQPRLPLAVAVSILLQISAALEYVHGICDASGEPLDLLHRDVSPENVMVRYDGGVKLIDFGIAHMAQQTFATKVDVMKGKIGYMSPEQLRQDPLGKRSDIYQLGILAYELTTGQRLFTGQNFAAVMNSVLGGEIPRPSRVVAELPAAVEDLILKALAYEPEDRPSGAASFARRLGRVALDLGLAVGPDVIARELHSRFPDADRQPTLDATTEHRAPEGSETRASLLPGVLAALALASAVGVVVLGEFLPPPTTESEALGRWRLQVGLGIVALGALAALTVSWLASRRQGAA